MRTIFVLFILFLINGALIQNTQASQKSFSFGVVPQHKALRSAAQWQPLLDYIGKKTGYDLKFATGVNISQFTQAYLEGEYDFVYVNPYMYTRGHNEEGYCAFAKETDRTLQAILPVHKDNAIQNIAELKGNKIALPSIDAFSSTLLKAYLNQRDIQVQPVYLGTHDQVYMSVYQKQYIAGGGVVRTFMGINENSALRQNLRILFKTDTYTGHALAAHPRVPHDVVKQILNVMQTLSNDVYGRHLLDQVQLNGIEMAEDAEWDIIRLLFSDIEE